MDCREGFFDPINPLPQKCMKCGFPDLDHVPQPYFLIKSRTISPNDLALASNGNFLLRERIRRVLDLFGPGQCSYFPTYYKGTSQQTPWLLGVPNHQVVVAKVSPKIPRCEACDEPRSAHPGTQWVEYQFGVPGRNQPQAKGWTQDADYEVLKSATWGSSEKGWNQWISRDLFMSVRLLHLLKKIKAKGFYEATCQEPTPPDKQESAWVREKFQELASAGIPLHADGTLSDYDAKWLCEYIKAHMRAAKADWDIKTVERRIKAKLPKSYIDFANAVGPTSFENVDEQEGFTACILGPNELGIEGIPSDFEDEESKKVNGLTFATTLHGDCFCFDIQKGVKEYAVYLFKHEYNHLEPYAANFAACVKRFAGGNDL
ncbi:MAG: SMI1/KNR4 family protein [Planctomycetes bacterium]|nr:SMI1/KNR4 family protein [Planctomycetota bacterium]